MVIKIQQGNEEINSNGGNIYFDRRINDSRRWVALAFAHARLRRRTTAIAEFGYFDKLLGCPRFRSRSASPSNHRYRGIWLFFL
jgi:hypothetical protein